MARGRGRPAPDGDRLVKRYGAGALEHWRAYLPGSYGRLEDPVRFFTDPGEQADAEIEDRYLEYAGPDVRGESAEGKQARLTPGYEPGGRGIIRGAGNADPGQPG